MKTQFWIIFFLLNIFMLKAYAQKFEIPKFDIGVGFRFLPWVLESKPATSAVYGNYYPFQESFTRFYFGIREKIPGRNNLSVALSNYITYTKIGNKPETNSVDKRFKRDHFIDVTNCFNCRKERLHLVLGLGAGFMNYGTEFRYIKRGYDNLGQVYIVDSNATATQRFFAPRLIIGAQNEGSNASVIFHGTPDREGEQYPTIWMEIRLAFTINPFVKKKKF